jgi:DnaJ-class molecular chaperone
MTKRIKAGPAHSIASFTVKVRGEIGCTVCSTADGAESQAACYLSTRPLGQVDVFYSEQCARCRGAGRVSKNRRTLAWMTCPVCKGAAETTPDTLLVTHTRAS